MLYFRVFVNIESRRSLDSFLGLNLIPPPRFPNSFSCHRSEKTPAKSSHCHTSKTPGNNPRFRTLCEKPPGVGGGYTFGKISGGCQRRTMPRRIPRATASVRLPAPTLPRIEATLNLPVCSEFATRPATSLLPSPPPTIYIPPSSPTLTLSTHPP